MKREKYVKICPRCGSTNVVPWTKLGLSTGEQLTEYCKDCYYGYPGGGFFPEVEISEIKEFRKRLKKSEKEAEIDRLTEDTTEEATPSNSETHPRTPMPTPQIKPDPFLGLGSTISDGVYNIAQKSTGRIIGSRLSERDLTRMKGGGTVKSGDSAVGIIDWGGGRVELVTVTPTKSASTPNPTTSKKV